MPGLTLIVDGITLQHAGELFYETGVSSEFRKKCTRAYVRCAEDAAFAALLGKDLLHVGNLPPVNDQAPGQTLLERIGRVSFVPEDEDLPDPKTLLADPDYRPRIAESLVLTRKANLLLPLWGPFFIREADAYLGEHESRYIADYPVEQREFAAIVRDGKERPYYYQDPELQALVPDKFVTEMVGMLRPTVGRRVVSEHLSELVRRAALTHLTIAEWYDGFHAKGSEDQRARIPFGTRASLWMARDGEKTQIPGTEGAQDSSLTAKQLRERNEYLKRLRDTVVPHALSHAIKHVNHDRFLLADRLRDMWDHKDYAFLRDRLQKAVQNAYCGEFKDAGKLITEIEKCRNTKFGNELPDSVNIGLSGGVGIDLLTGHPQLSLTPELMKQIGRLSGYARPRYARRRNLMLRRWVQGSPYQGYFYELKRCFPELDMRRMSTRLR